ncbi:protein MEI2-like 5 [Ipomoea triloba]|uniref:protein MEI2-like 5 n=1 Tax=Ipomoea triloba TaxID=35885 RepID=UPI00125DC819|nr:protein MEI2-like 5 [Ipomoea triloba]XP_031130519.1 protein MEI2-like 5 [Ipomoea triloba]XP_031130520.1 protein MEI2-like 5 [Ipomoea triloba]XP_031130521.1 protein MEI2-like 5 [Ipomoea triloba]
MTNISKGNTTLRVFPGIPGSDSFDASTDASLFSSSLPVLSHEKLNMSEVGRDLKSIDDTPVSLKKIHPAEESDDLLQEIIRNTIKYCLPDDEDDLLSGVVDGYDLGGLRNRTDDLEDYDLFGSGGGLELESDPQESLTIGISRLSVSDIVGASHNGLPNGGGAISGEHPLGEHPSRTLFVRNINSNVEDSELKNLFEQYGDIRTMYTACKHRGFVMISYYDIRAARTAMRALQNKPLRRRKLDIHFSIPKDNPSEKDINQGTLVVFNLDPSVSNDDLHQIFGSYGEIKEIRETPHKRHHKFIEFYDVRAAEAALRSLNKSDIAGKRIKLEPSRPGGSRRNFLLQLNHDLEQEESRSLPHQLSSSIGNSPTGNWQQFGSPADHSPIQSLGNSNSFRSANPASGNNLAGLASILSPQALNTVKVAPIGKFEGSAGQAEQLITIGNSKHGASIPQPHSFPEPKPSWYSGPISSYGASSSNGSGIETLSGTQFLWGSPKVYPEQSNPSPWHPQTKGHPFTSNVQSRGFPFSNQHGSFVNSSQQHRLDGHYVGSAPSGLPFERRMGFFPESPEASYLSPGYKGMGGTGPRERSYMNNMGGANGALSSNLSISGNMSMTDNNGSPGFGMLPSQRSSPAFMGSGIFPGPAAMAFEGLTERGRVKRVEVNGNQIDNKRFQLDLDKIRTGGDARTTLMIKNIPNKYTSKMLLATIDENHRGTYDFLYLPIDFKNKCNVGYAFINMLSPSLIIPFYEAFNGKKWEKFNSEKVASLAYARIQGKGALVAHFQNSSLMNEDKRCRPIVFHSESSESGSQIIQEHLSSSMNIQSRQSIVPGLSQSSSSLTEKGEELIVA